MKRLHCCCDEKFIMGMISLFEEDTTEVNDYVVVSESNMLKYVDNSLVRVISPKQLYDECLKYDVIFIHYLKSYFFNIIPNLPSSIRVVWFGWGGDMYDGNNAIVKSNYYDRLTEKYVRRNSSILKQVGGKIKYYITTKHKRNNTLERIDYFSGVFPYEYDLIKSAIKGFKAEPLDFYYGSTSFFVPEKPSDVYDINEKQNIIVGNSAAYTNNHLDALIKIKESGWTNNSGKVIIPLSYGGEEKYKDEIIKLGKDLFDNSFVPLMTFLPLDEYQKMVCSCKAAVFYHKRQQASDNVFMQILNGARVFMSSDNPMFAYLKSQGYKVFSLEEDSQLINIPLSLEEVILNRKLLSQQYSSSRLIQRVKDIDRKIRARE